MGEEHAIGHDLEGISECSKVLHKKSVLLGMNFVSIIMLFVFLLLPTYLVLAPEPSVIFEF